MTSHSNWEIELKRIKPLRVAHSHVLSETPEEDVWKKIETWARCKGLLTGEKGTRIFGRNTYPTNNPEPHGYELFLTVDHSIIPEGDIKIGEIPGGLYAVLKSTSLDQMGDAWRYLWSWIEKSEYEFSGWKRGEHGWVNGYEEHLNPFEGKPPPEWLFNLWIPLKE